MGVLLQSKQNPKMLAVATSHYTLQGCSCVSIQWGAWAVAGMAAADAALLARLARQGYGAVQPAAGLRALAQVISGSFGCSVSEFVASPFMWSTFLKGMNILFSCLITHDIELPCIAL